MKKIDLRNAKKGELLFLKNPEEHPTAALYVKGDYIRDAKKYELYMWEDVNHFTYKKGDFPVYVEEE